MRLNTLYIGFEGRLIAVHTRNADLHQGLLGRYKGLLQPSDSRDVIGAFEIVETGDGFSLAGGRNMIASSLNLVNLLEALNYEIGLMFVDAFPDFLWMHAGAVARDGQAVMFAASWGRGKSTLAVRLVEHGWTFLSDDLLPYDPVSGKILPFPRAPAMRINDKRELPRERVGELRKIVFDFGPEMISRESTDLCAVVFPSFGFKGPDCYERCNPADATVELLRNCLNFLDHRGQGVHHMCALMERLPAFKLHFSAPGRALNMVSEIHSSTFRRDCVA